MQRTRWTASLVAICTAFLTTHLPAMPFDPAFRLSKIDGTCSVRTPGATEYVLGEQGKAYPYGTLIKTGPGSRAFINLSTQSSIDLGPDAEAMISDADRNIGPRTKSLHLFNGKADIELERNFQEDNAFSVVTHCFEVIGVTGPVLPDGATADASKLKFSVTASAEDRMRTILAACGQGEVKVTGPHFEIPTLGTGHKVGVACTLDRSFLRIRCEAGPFGIQVHDSNATPRLAELAPGSIIRILQQPSTSGDATVVTVLEIDPNNQPVRADSYNTPPTEDNLLSEGPDGPPPGAPTTPQTPAGTPSAAPAQTQKPRAEGEWTPIPEITTTTTTTTTTTVPPGFQPFTPPSPTPTTTTKPPRRTTTTTSTTTTTTKPEATSVGLF